MTVDRNGTGEAGDATQALGAASNQLNILFLLDIARLLADGAPEAGVYAVDNDPRSSGKGTLGLVTHCRTGQVLNWLCRPVAEPQFTQMPGMPTCPAPSIAAIVFRHGESAFTRGEKVLDDLHSYGAPDRFRSPLTPSYSYWAGTVRASLPPGRYHYRVIFALAPWAGWPGRLVELESASLLVAG